MTIPFRLPLLILFSAAAALPLVTSNTLFFPSPWAQAMVFRVLVSLLAIAFLLLILQSNIDKAALLARIRSAKTVLYSFAAFLAVLAVATVFSEDFYFSFWGTPSRGWGVLNYFLLAAFALVAFLFLDSKAWKKIWNVAFWAGAGVAAIAIFQTFDLFPSIFHVAGGGRAPGTLGSPLVLGLYLLFLAFAALAFKRFPFFFLFAAIAALTLSRSAWLGLLLGILFFLLPRLRKRKLLRTTVFLMMGGGLAMVLAINIFSPPSLLVDHRLATFAWERLQWENAIDKARLLAWKTDLPALGEKPVLGWGPYNSGIAFNKHFDPIITTETRAIGYFDTSHNYYLDLALGAGFLGLGAYLFFFGSLFLRLWRVPEEKQWEARGLQAGLLGSHAVLFFFPFLFPNYLIFFLLAAYALHLISSKPPISVPEYVFVALRTRQEYTKRALLLGACSVLVLFAFFTAIQPLLLNRSSNAAIRLAEAGSCTNAILLAEDLRAQATSGFFAYWIHLQYVEAVSECISYQEPKTQHELSKRIVNSLEEELKIRPQEPRTWILLGGYLNNLAAFETNPAKQATFLQEARIALQRAKQLSPRRHEIFAELTRTELLTEDYIQAKNVAQRCLELGSSVAEWCWIRVVLSEIHLGNVDEGMAILQKAQEQRVLAIEFKHKPIIQEMLRVLVALPEKPYAHIATLYEHLRQLDPETNPQYYAALADAYFHLGQYEAAASNALLVLRFQPENKVAIAKFLRQIPPAYVRGLHLDHAAQEFFYEFLPGYLPSDCERFGVGC